MSISSILPEAVAAMRKRPEDVERILDNEDLCTALQYSFRMDRSYREILDEMGGNRTLGLSEDISEAEVGRVLRIVKKTIMGTFAAKKHANAVHAASAQRHEQELASKRRLWMIEQGFFVWSPEEHACFMDLIQDPAMKRPGISGRLNHTKLATTMNERFQTDRFEPKHTAKHLEDSNKEIQKAKRMRIRQRKYENGNGNGSQDGNGSLI